jgi:hypothetical protein
MHYGHDPNPIGPFQVKDSVREALFEVPSHRRVEHPTPQRIEPNLAHQAVDMFGKTMSKGRADGCVSQRRFYDFPAGCRVEAKRLHNPTILRTSAITCSPGIDST